MLIYVEGETEKYIFKDNFGLNTRRIGINGDNVSVEAIFQNISTDLISLKKPSEILIMFDREGRKETSKQIQDKLLELLEKNFPVNTYHVIVTDRDIESWIFSDIENTSKYFRKKLGNNNKFEGKSGCKEIKRLLGSGIYNKTYDGPRLIKTAKWSNIKKNNTNAENSGLDGIFSNCLWIKT